MKRLLALLALEIATAATAMVELMLQVKWGKFSAPTGCKFPHTVANVYLPGRKLVMLAHSPVACSSHAQTTTTTTMFR